MNKLKTMLPLLALVFAVSIAWTTRPADTLSDKVWFEVNQNGVAIDPSAGIRSEMSPFNCGGGNELCARSLSLEQEEVSLNDGSSTQYHINSGFSTQDDYDFEETKQ